jgi:hypothetical protein
MNLELLANICKHLPMQLHINDQRFDDAEEEPEGHENGH